MQSPGPVTCIVDVHLQVRVKFHSVGDAQGRFYANIGHAKNVMHSCTLWGFFSNTRTEAQL